MTRLSSEKTKNTTIRVELIALLGAYALFLSTIEYMIPKPIPFMRLGLANLPLMIALGLLSPTEFFLLVVLKILGQALVSGTLFSYVVVFSFGGTVASAVVMYLLYRMPRLNLTLVGIGVAGAMASNIVQLLLSRIILFGKAAFLIAPPFLALGLATSIALGIFSERFVRLSVWYKTKLGESQ